MNSFFASFCPSGISAVIAPSSIFHIPGLPSQPLSVLPSKMDSEESSTCEQLKANANRTKFVNNILFIIICNC